MSKNKGSMEWYRLDGEDYTIMRMLDKAILIKTTDGEEIWLPKSQMDSYDEKEIVMKAWIAKEKGFIS